MRLFVEWSKGHNDNKQVGNVVQTRAKIISATNRRGIIQFANDCDIGPGNQPFDTREFWDTLRQRQSQRQRRVSGRFQ